MALASSAASSLRAMAGQASARGRHDDIQSEIWSPNRRRRSTAVARSPPWPRLTGAKRSAAGPSPSCSAMPSAMIACWSSM